MGPALMGSLRFLFTFFDGGTFWALPLTCFCLPKTARGVPFSPICRNSLLFCSGPISVDPICPQPLNYSICNNSFNFMIYYHISMILIMKLSATKGLGRDRAGCGGILREGEENKQPTTSNNEHLTLINIYQHNLHTICTIINTIQFYYYYYYYCC